MATRRIFVGGEALSDAANVAFARFLATAHASCATRRPRRLCASMSLQFHMTMDKATAPQMRLAITGSPIVLRRLLCLCVSVLALYSSTEMIWR